MGSFAWQFGNADNYMAGEFGSEMMVEILVKRLQRFLSQWLCWRMGELAENQGQTLK